MTQAGRPRIVVVLVGPNREKITVRRRVSPELAADSEALEPLIAAEKMRARWRAKAAGVDVSQVARYLVSVRRDH